MAGLRESVRERRALLRIAPALVRRSVRGARGGHGPRGRPVFAAGLPLNELLCRPQRRRWPRIGAFRGAGRWVRRGARLGARACRGRLAGGDPLVGRPGPEQRTARPRLPPRRGGSGAALANYVEAGPFCARATGRGRRGEARGGIERGDLGGARAGGRECHRPRVRTRPGPGRGGSPATPLLRGAQPRLAAPAGRGTSPSAPPARVALLFLVPWRGRAIVGTSYDDPGRRAGPAARSSRKRESAFPWADLEPADVALVHQRPGARGRAAASSWRDAATSSLTTPVKAAPAGPRHRAGSEGHDGAGGRPRASSTFAFRRLAPAARAAPRSCRYRRRVRRRGRWPRAPVPASGRRWRPALPTSSCGGSTWATRGGRPPQRWRRVAGRHGRPNWDGTLASRSTRTRGPRGVLRFPGDPIAAPHAATPAAQQLDQPRRGLPRPRDAAVKALLATAAASRSCPFALADHQAYTAKVTARLEQEGIEVDGVTPDADGRRRHRPLRRGVRGRRQHVPPAGRPAALAPCWTCCARARVAGMPYLGASAGTNIAAPTIRTTNDMPIVQPASLRGARARTLPDQPALPRRGPASSHMGETRETRLREYLEENETPVVGLREGAWLRRVGDTRTLGGATGARVFRRDAEPVELAPGSGARPPAAGRYCLT